MNAKNAFRPIPGATANGSRAYRPINSVMLLATSTVAVIAPVNGTPCRVLCEVCDPSEASSYTPHGGDLPVSDFYLPEWFDAVPQRFTEYSFTGALLRPGQVIAGGYMSYIGPDNKWYQITYWGDAPQTDGPFDWQRKPGESLREMIDRETRARRPAQA